MKPYSIFKRHLATMTEVSLVITLLCVWNIASFAADWPQWRGPNRDGISSEKGWLTTWPAGGPKQLWKLAVGVGYSAVSVSNGRVYTMGNKAKTDTIYCLDASNGVEIWKYSYPCASEGNEHPGTASTPTVDGKRVYTLSREGHLFCLDADSGKVIWSKDVRDFGAKTPSWGFASSALIADDMVIVDAGMALALNKSTGNLIWKTKDYGNSWGIENQGGGYSSAIAFQLSGVKRLAAFNSSGLTILNPKDGQELMLHPWKTSYNANIATPIISGDKVFISSGYNSGCALIQVSGDKPVVVWQNKNIRNHFNSCVLWNGYIYGFDESQLRCLNWNTGEVKWTQKGLGKGSLMVADGKLIIMSDSGELVIAEAIPDSFKELARAKVLDGLCWTVPVLSSGKIYCKNHEGDLVCVDVKGK